MDYLKPDSQKPLKPGKILKDARRGQWEIFRLSACFVFVMAVMLYAAGLASGEGAVLLAVAAAIGAYMALNIGANDVANNVGPAVGSKAITLLGALVIAAVCEAAGALLAGGDVVATIRGGIVDPTRIPEGASFVRLMMAALLAGALWLNIATAVGAPVSTSHSIVGAVLGAGIAAVGVDVVRWEVMGGIAASWVISPLLGAAFAAVFLALVRRTITQRPDMALAAARYVPVLVAVMVWVFAAYLLLKGLKQVWAVTPAVAFGVGAALALAVYLALRPYLRARVFLIDNSREGVNRLFTLPLVFAAALLSFAHGANDVANAVGPLAAICDVVMGGGVAGEAAIPLWVMAVGALGIVIGLGLYGPRVIRTVGSEITELDKISAWCVAMSATVTVLAASHLGLPVSSTHIAVGGVFGVGFLREYWLARYARVEAEIRAHHSPDDQAALDAFLARFNAATVSERGAMLKELKRQYKLRADPVLISKPERKGLKKEYRREVVKRAQVKKIVAAWLITVPASAAMAAAVFFLLRGVV